MRISLKKILVIAGLGLVVGCAPSGVGGDAGVECTSNLDCEGTDQCQLELGVCETPCTSDAECTEDGRTVCNMLPDPDGEYPLDVDGTRDHCICQEGTCPAGETCSATGLCEPGDDVDAGPQDECTDDTECGADEVCVDGGCQAQCFDEDCWVDGDLCVLAEGDPEFNQCVLADELTSDCDEATGAPAQTGTDDIVIYFVETLADPVANGCNVGGTDFPLRSFLLSIYSEVDLSAEDAQAVLFRPGFDAGNEKFFEDAGASVESEIVALDGFPDEYIATVYICGSPNGAAAQVDTGDSVSNAYCFDPAADPL